MADLWDLPRKNLSQDNSSLACTLATSQDRLLKQGPPFPQCPLFLSGSVLHSARFQDLHPEAGYDLAESTLKAGWNGRIRRIAGDTGASSAPSPSPPVGPSGHPGLLSPSAFLRGGSGGEASG